MFGRWSTINEKGELEYFEDIKEPRYNPQIENYTDYYFSPKQKVNTLVEDLGKEANNTWKNIDSVFTNVGAGIQNGSKVLKVLPIFALATIGYLAYKRFA